MRLLTHNQIMCIKRKCGDKSFPLAIRTVKVDRVPSDFSPKFVLHLIPKIDYPALRKACGELQLPVALPEQPPASLSGPEAEPFLRSLHEVLLEVDIVQGALFCTNCGREYPIKDGIPTMLLHEDELE